MFTRVSTVVGKILLGIVGTVVAIVLLGAVWFKLVVPGGHFVGELFTLTNQRNQEVAQPLSNTSTDQGNDSTVAAAAPEVIPVSSGSALDSFPATTAYTVTMNFKDGTSLTKGLMTDLDLQDDKETWARIQLVGISDLVVSNTTPLLFFYNGYVFPINGGQDQSLGEIWEQAMSADVNYDSGFALRQLANGCRELSSTWTDADGNVHMQAQTAVNIDLAGWLEQYCDASEIAQWKADRATLGMPESLFTK